MRNQSCRLCAWAVAVAVFWVAANAVQHQDAALAKDHPHIDRPASVAVASSAGDRAVTGGDSTPGNKKKVTLWDVSVDPPTLFGTYKKTHDRKVSYVAVWLNPQDPAQSKLFQASFDGDVVVSRIDPKAANPILATFTHAKPAGATADVEAWVVAPSPDGNFALSSTNFGEIKLWGTGANPANAVGGVDGLTVFNPVGGLIFLPKPAAGNQRFIAGHYDGKARVYEMVPGAVAGNFDLRNTITFDTGVAAAVNCVAITPDGNKLVTSGFDQEIRVWDLKAAAGTPANPVTVATPLVEIKDHEDIVWRVAVSPAKDPDIGEEKIASASEDGTLRLFTISGKPLKDNMGMPAMKKELDADTNGFMGVAFATNNKVVYTAGNLKKKEEVKVWDITGFKP